MCCLNNNNKMNIHPTINELKNDFEDIYTAEDPLEIEDLSRNVYIPALDDPIDSKGVEEALNDYKKVGYNFAENNM